MMDSEAVNMRHATAGNALMLKTATSASQFLLQHNSQATTAQPATVGLS